MLARRQFGVLRLAAALRVIQRLLRIVWERWATSLKREQAPALQELRTEWPGSAKAGKWRPLQKAAATGAMGYFGGAEELPMSRTTFQVPSCWSFQMLVYLPCSMMGLPSLSWERNSKVP